MIASAAGRSAPIPSWAPDRHRGFPRKSLRVAARWKYLANVRRWRLIDLARSSIKAGNLLNRSTGYRLCPVAVPQRARRALLGRYANHRRLGVFQGSASQRLSCRRIAAYVRRQVVESARSQLNGPTFFARRAAAITSTPCSANHRSGIWESPRLNGIPPIGADSRNRCSRRNSSADLGARFSRFSTRQAVLTFFCHYFS
jgi:hypothetical protein